MAGNNEVLIGGKFSPDVELTAGHEKQIGSVTVTYENYGAKLNKKGESKTFEYVTLQATQEELNHLENSGEVCGAVHISYKLAEKSGRSYTQYLTEREPEPTPAPTATPKPTSTPKPTAVPFTTPIPDGQLTIACTSDKTGQAFSFEVSGTKAEGGRFSKDFKTGTDGKIITEIPAGLRSKFTVACHYVAVDLTVWSSSTDSPVVGADLVLLSNGEELAK